MASGSNAWLAEAVRGGGTRAGVAESVYDTDREGLRTGRVYGQGGVQVGRVYGQERVYGQGGVQVGSIYGQGGFMDREVYEQEGTIGRIYGQGGCMSRECCMDKG